MGFFKRAGKVANGATIERRKRRLQSCVFVAGILLLPGLVILGGVVSAIYGWFVQRELDALEASIRAKGEPVTIEELNAYYPKVPDAENGALIYLKAMDALAAIDNENLQSYKYHLADRLEANTYSLETLAAVRQYLAAREPVVETLTDALNCSRFHYPVGLGVLIEDDRIYLSLRHAHKLGELLWIRGFIALHDRDWAVFTESQQNLFHFAESLASIPGWHSVTAVSILAHARDLAQLAISMGEVTDVRGEELQRLFDQVDPGDLTHPYYIRMRCHNVALLQAFTQGDISPYQAGLPIRARWMQLGWLPGSRCVALIERRSILRFTTGILDDYGKPLRDRFANSIARQPYFENWNYELKRRTYRADGTWLQEEMTIGDIIKGCLKPELYVGESPLFFNYFDVTDYIIYEEAQFLLLRMALLINNYREKTGEFPVSAELLGPDVVLDPYDGAPLRFKVVEGGFIVYSVGDDLIDHGGIKPSDEGTDIVMEFVRSTRVVPEKDPPRESRLGHEGARWASGD